MRPDLLLQLLTKFQIPLIVLFALYVQFHGDYSPGGGFQAGVIACAGIVLYVLAFGLEKTEELIPPVYLKFLSAAGVLIYAGTGVFDMLLGGEFLNYSVMSDDPVKGQHLGIIAIEAGVGITVASTLTLIFFTFAHWSRET